MKILVVDDNKRVRELIIKLLKNVPQSISTLECEDGDEAIKLFQIEKPEIILMDIMMRRMDGFSAIYKIRELSSNVKIIVVSQLPEQEYRDEAFETGADDYLNKENLSELPNLIEKIINKQTN